MLLADKVAVVYGAGGAIGSAVARAFAADGARVFVTGRRLEPLEDLATEITGAGGWAEAAVVDAVDEEAIDEHLQSVVERAGRIDISFNAVGVPNRTILGEPLVELDVAQFELPIELYTTTYFLTARLAARNMMGNGAGVIMTVSALPARSGTRLNGGYGAAQAAKEAMTRDLSIELAPHGIRVVSLRPHGIPDTRTMEHVFSAKPSGLTWEQFTAALVASTHPRRGMRVEEVADMAVFLASDKASGMTGTTVNLTMGAIDD